MVNQGRTYSIGFLAAVLILLLSFLALPGVSLTSLSEQFRWRTDLIRSYNTLRFKAGDHVFNNAVVGTHGWIYYMGGLSIREYQHTDPLGQRTLKALQTELDQLNADLAKEGKTLLLVIPPNKPTVYPEYMPQQIPVIGATSRLDEFAAYMRSNGQTRVVDLRSTLINASKTQLTYYKTDSHWNDLGAYYGYVDILNALSTEYPVLKPHALSDFIYEPDGSGTLTDLPGTMGLFPFEEDGPRLTPRFPSQTETISAPLADGTDMLLTTNQDQQLPRLLIFGDSFYDSLAKFLEPHFSHITALTYRRPPGRAGSRLAYQIHTDKPDIVIIECVERGLEELFPLLESWRR
jgi:hypothetical protein